MLSYDKQRKAFWALVRAMALTETERQTIVYTFNERGTTHFSELNPSERRQVLEYLRYEADKRGVDTDRAKADRMRKKVIAKVASYLEQDTLDMNAVNAFVFAKGYLKKPLMQYKSTELPKLVTQMGKILESKHEQNRKRMRPIN